MGVNVAVVAVLLHVPFFGGASGIGGIPAPRWFGEPVGGPGFFALVLADLLIALAINRWLRRSWASLTPLAARDDEEAAQVSGVDVRSSRITAFTTGTALAGLAGSFYAHHLGLIAGRDFGFPFSIAILGVLALAASAPTVAPSREP